MESATTWVDMCHPSASSAMDPVMNPATISATMVAAVIATTSQVRRSARWLPGSYAWLCCQPLRSWIAMTYFSRAKLSSNVRDERRVAHFLERLDEVGWRKRRVHRHRAALDVDLALGVGIDPGQR